MKLEYSERGFEQLYLGEEPVATVRMSSKIGDYPDAFDKPGSSALWIGDTQLDRNAVAELTGRLHWWLKTGTLNTPK